MDEATLDILAQQAGLARALAQFRDDVQAAATLVEQQRAALPPHRFSPADEPWPSVTFRHG